MIRAYTEVPEGDIEAWAIITTSNAWVERAKLSIQLLQFWL